jgi:hypothetical protein
MTRDHRHKGDDKHDGNDEENDENEEEDDDGIDASAAGDGFIADCR